MDLPGHIKKSLPFKTVVEEHTGVQEHPINFIGKFGGNNYFKNRL